MGRPVNIHVPETVAPLHADELLLTQVLINLIENAVKYTPPGSPLSIEAEEGKGRLRLDVRDTGPGIPEGEATRIFEKFYRAGSRSSSRPTKGAGLGLAICKAIVEAHGGTIEALNNPDGGATFRIDLPAGAAA